MKKILAFVIALLIALVPAFCCVASVSGDADGDGNVTAADARFVLRASVGLENAAPGSVLFTVCDTDGDGAVTAADARMVLRASVHLETLSEIPVEEPSSEEPTSKALTGGYAHGVYVPGLVQDISEADYVVNTNTGKFHHKGCRAVSEMKEKNRAYSAAARSELTDCGFSPCGICNP